MELILEIAYLILFTLVMTYLYYLSSVFLKLGTSTVEEMNEGEEEDLVDEKDSLVINYIGATAFILAGMLIWALMATTAGKVASGITEHNFLKWVVYILIYFLFLRIPFGVGSRLVQQSFRFKAVPEKILFSIAMLVFYILAICCYENLPDILKWHLTYFN